MSGWATYADLVASARAQEGILETLIHKRRGTNDDDPNLNSWGSLWRLTGPYPGPGADGAASPGTAHVNEGIAFEDCDPVHKHLVDIALGVQYGTFSFDTEGVFLIYDRLVSVNMPLTTESAQTVNSVALPRYTSGEGVQAWWEVSVDKSIGAPDLTLSLSSYTNSAGTAGRVGGTTTYGSQFNEGNTVWFPLQDGDKGIRSIEEFTCTAGGSPPAAGSVNLVLARPITFMRFRNFGATQTHGLLDSLMLPRLYDGASLGVLLRRANTTSTTETMRGELHVVKDG